MRLALRLARFRFPMAALLFLLLLARREVHVTTLPVQRSNADMVQLPDVRSKKDNPVFTESAAEQVTSRGLYVTVVSANDKPVAKQRETIVVGQEPEPGQVQAGSNVKLTVITKEHWEAKHGKR